MDEARGLSSMPLEMLDHIIQYLDFKDILSLRGVSRVINWFTLKTFVKYIIPGHGHESFQTNRSMLKVDASPRGLIYFQALAKYTEVSLPARVLVVKASLADEESRRDFSPPQFPDTLNIGLSDELIVERDEFEKLCHKYQQYPNRLAEMRATFEDISRMKKALNLTRNLVAVWLQDIKSPKNWWNFTPTTQSIVNAITRAATVLLSGIVRSRAQIDFLSFGEAVISDVKSAWLDDHLGDQFCLKGACRLSAFDIPRLLSPLPIPGLQNLRVFVATIWDCGESSQAFGRFLKACPQLKSIAISGITHMAHENLKVCLKPCIINEIATSIRPGGLKQLWLVAFLAHPDDLQRLLERQKHSLEALILAQGHLVDGQWKAFYRQLLSNTGLRYLWLGVLFELYADHYVRRRDGKRRAIKVHVRSPEVIRKTLEFLIEGDEADCGDYSAVVDFMNWDKEGRSMLTGNGIVLCQNSRQWAQGWAQGTVDMSLDSSWLFFDQLDLD